MAKFRLDLDKVEKRSEPEKEETRGKTRTNVAALLVTDERAPANAPLYKGYPILCHRDKALCTGLNCPKFDPNEDPEIHPCTEAFKDLEQGKLVNTLNVFAETEIPKFVGFMKPRAISMLFKYGPLLQDSAKMMMSKLKSWKEAEKP